MNANLRNFALWVIIVLLLLALFTVLQNGGGQRTQATEISFSTSLKSCEKEISVDCVRWPPPFWRTVNKASSSRTIMTQSAKFRRLAFMPSSLVAGRAARQPVV